MADDIAESLTERAGVWTDTVCVDSMQVYSEIPIISNQGRRRRAELVSVTSATREWNMSRHREAADRVFDASKSEDIVLDAGTGMYLSGILTDLEISPRVPDYVRREAEALAANESPLNRRRRIRELELEIVGAKRTASIWEAEPRFDTTLVVLRPPLEKLYKAIDERTERISSAGTGEVSNLRLMAERGEPATPQVMNAIGVREINEYLEGTLSKAQAVERISKRTRALAKRQITWFDKLARTLGDHQKVRVRQYTSPEEAKNSMRDIV